MGAECGGRGARCGAGCRGRSAECGAECGVPRAVGWGAACWCGSTVLPHAGRRTPHPAPRTPHAAPGTARRTPHPALRTLVSFYSANIFSLLIPFNAFRVLPTALFVIAVLVLFLASAGLVAVTLSWVAATTVVGAIVFTLAFTVRGSVPDGDQPPPRSRERVIR